jgi:mono/diheme cytochrome c family protein
MKESLFRQVSNPKAVGASNGSTSTRRSLNSSVLPLLAVVTLLLLLVSIGVKTQAETPQGQGSAAKSADTTRVQNGKRLYNSSGCYQCHGGEGQGSIQTGGIRIGPPPVELEEFVAYVRQPVGDMPPYASKALSDAQLADIYAFLRSRPLPPPAKSIPLLNN